MFLDFQTLQATHATIKNIGQRFFSIPKVKSYGLGMKVSQGIEGVYMNRVAWFAL